MLFKIALPYAPVFNSPEETNKVFLNLIELHWNEMNKQLKLERF